MPFDPATRRTTRILMESRENDKPVFRMAKYMFVSYDGDPDRYIEPVPQNVDGTGFASEIIVGMEVFGRRPYEVHSFDDGPVDN